MEHRAIERFEIDANRRAVASLTGSTDREWRKGLRDALRRKMIEVRGAEKSEFARAYTNYNGDAIYVLDVPRGKDSEIREQIAELVQKANELADRYGRAG
jgi:hypothetical protein